jgi:hypothetical protein
MKGLAGGHPQGRLLSHMKLTAPEAYRFCLSQPVASQVMGITSMEQLREDIALARNFKLMSAAEKDKLLARVKEEATDGRHELFKSSKQYDGPHHRRQHGFDVDAD